MTIQELIEILNKFDTDLEVYVPSSHDEDGNVLKYGNMNDVRYVEAYDADGDSECFVHLRNHK